MPGRAPDSYAGYIEGWRRRAAMAEETRRQRADAARRLLPTLVAHLVERYHAHRVVLIGSLAEGAFGSRSDIDLAVEGVGGAAIYLAGGELDDLAHPFRVDLVPIEDATPEMLARISAHGELLHG